MASRLICDTVELLYLGLMIRWENNAPPDGRKGILDGNSVTNSQEARLAYLLRWIGSGNEEKVFSKLALGTRRNDGESYVSKSYGWMNSPHSIGNTWFVEGCMRLSTKLEVVATLKALPMSSAFVSAACDFVSGNSVKPYVPTASEQDELVEKLRDIDQIITFEKQECGD